MQQYHATLSSPQSNPKEAEEAEDVEHPSAPVEKRQRRHSSSPMHAESSSQAKPFRQVVALCVSPEDVSIGRAPYSSVGAAVSLAVGAGVPPTTEAVRHMHQRLQTIFVIEVILLAPGFCYFTS